MLVLFLLSLKMFVKYYQCHIVAFDHLFAINLEY
jgi:hypothetical protein